MTEVELAKFLTTWLTETGWTVYQEVDGIDVVATRGSLCWAIEVKRSFSWKLLDQCLRLRGRWRAHLVSAAAPLPKDSGARTAIERSFRSLGVGVLSVQPKNMHVADHIWNENPRQMPVVECVRPRLQRRLSDDIRRYLTEEHKTYRAAGSPYGGGWSPFKATCRALLKYATANDGALLIDACRAIEHHYGSDRRASATLRVQVDRGLVPGVRVGKRRVGKRERVVVYAETAGRDPE